MIPMDAVSLANHLWQSTLFAAAVWVITLALRENRAAVRHSLWLVASVKFLIPFSFLMRFGNQFQLRMAAESGPARASVLVGAIGQPFSGLVTPEAASSLSGFSVSAFLLLVWSLGFIASLVWWAVQWRQLQRSASQATPINLNVPIRVVECPGRIEPGVFGIFRPVLLLPKGITDRLSSEQLRAVLAHEMCHVRRRDNWTGAIHMFVEALFWFYPIVWWIKLRLIDEQERACDEEVIRLGTDPQIYAESILKICECYLTSPSMCVAGISSSNLKKRIRDIMKNRIRLQLSFSRLLFLVTAATLALAGPIVAGIVSAPPGQGQFERTAQVVIPEWAGLQAPWFASVQPPAGPQGGQRAGGGSPSAKEYRITSISIKGNKLFNGSFTQQVLGLAVGDVYSDESLRKGFENLKQMYGSAGYINLVPTPNFLFDEDRKSVDLTIEIDEGPQFRINSIRFTGNTTTPDDVLRNNISLKEGAVFNATSWSSSIARLNQMGLFEEIRPEDTLIRPLGTEPKVDIDLRLKEKAR